MSKKDIQNASRKVYIDQVRNKNKSVKQVERGGYGEVAPHDPSDYPYSYYANADSDNELIKTPSGLYIPSVKSVGSTISNAYRRRGVNTIGNISMSTESFKKNGVISLPTGNYQGYVATMCAVIESTLEEGGMANSDLFMKVTDVKDESGRRIFRTTINRENIADNGLYLRKDFVYYLKILFERVKDEIGVKEFLFTSIYRSIKYNYNMYTTLLAKKRVSQRTYWSSHMGAIAVDIGLTGIDRAIVADAAYDMGFGGINIGNGFVHIDINCKRHHKYSGVPEYRGPGNPGRNHYTT